MAENTGGAQGRVLYLDVLRILATFFVILLHVAAQNWQVDIHSQAWRAFNLYDGISRWGVPVFVMISGALFLSRPVTLRQLFGKYILRIVTAFVFWSALYAFITQFLPTHSLRAFVAAFAKGHYHLWFLPMIACLYVIVPFLKQIADDRRLTWYFLILSLFFSFTLSPMRDVALILSPKNGAVLDRVVNNTHFHFALGYSAYFLLGYSLSREPLSLWKKGAIYLLGVAGLFLTVALTHWLSFRTGAANTLFYGNDTLNVLAVAVMVFVACREGFAHVRLSASAQRVVKAMSKFSFGAYLVHVMVLNAVDQWLHLNTLSLNPYLSVPLIAVLVFSLSLTLSAILNQIPAVKRYLV